MKALVFSLLFLVPISIFSQKAETIISIAQKQFPIDYYHTQSKLWKKKIDQKSNHVVAWENYYAACRMANLLTSAKEKPYPLDQIIQQASKAIPNTFEYHRIAYWNGAIQPKNYHHLEKAYKLDPERSEMYDSMISMYETKRNKAKKKFFSQKLYDLGEYSPGTMDWNYNQLISVEDDAILLTYGDFDTYPSWVLQEVKNIKPNVAILNLSMLRNGDYRRKIFQELKVSRLKNYTGDVDIKDFTAFIVALVPHLAQQQNKPVYLGVGCGRKIIDNFDSELYLVGLAFKYSEKTFDNIAILQEHVENDFALDQLRLNLYKDKSESILNRINRNYLPALVMLYKHYKTTKNPKMKALKNLIERIAETGGMGDKVEKLFH